MDFTHWTNLIFKKLEGWLTTLIKMLPNILVATVVLVIAYFFAKLIRNLTYKLTLKISKSDSVSSVVSVVLQMATLFFAITIVLSILNLQTAVSSLLAGVGIVGLALGFAFQDLTANFIAGLFMAFKRPFEIGDKVETNAFTGIIEEVKLRSTTLITTAGLYVIIPNKDIFQKPIINHSRSENRRVELEFTIASTKDLADSEKIIRNSLGQIQDASAISDVEFYYTGIDDAKIKLTTSFRIDTTDPKGLMNHRHKAIMAIHKALGDHGFIKIEHPEMATA